jgi:predicted  nucleic acid-binding Zn-ribbon protein
MKNKKFFRELSKIASKLTDANKTVLSVTRDEMTGRPRRELYSAKRRIKKLGKSLASSLGQEEALIFADLTVKKLISEGKTALTGVKQFDMEDQKNSETKADEMSAEQQESVEVVAETT